MYAPLKAASARLALAEGSHKLLAVFNLKEAHSHYALIDTRAENQTTKAHGTLWHHNFDQRAVFDGSDFVVMEKRDHDVPVTLLKVSPNEKSPEKNGEWQDRLGKVRITRGEPVTLKDKPRPHWHDDAFAFNGGLARVTGESGGRALVLHAVTPGGEYRATPLALP